MYLKYFLTTSATSSFVSLEIFVYPAILSVSLPCLFADSYWFSMFILSESNFRGTHGNNPREYPLSGCQVNLLSDLSSQNNWPNAWELSRVPHRVLHIQRINNKVSKILHRIKIPMESESSMVPHHQWLHVLVPEEEL
jgi:hypothetical protein